MIPVTFSWLGLTFHLYGLTIGLAVMIWYLLFQRQALAYAIKPKIGYQAALLLLGGGLIGARLWHVATDWGLYATDPWRAIWLWQGGLSILGAVAGGVLTLLIVSFFKPDIYHQLGRLLASCVLALPLAQAIGRLGNYVNQELYGYPTQLPWGIAIDPQSRLPQYLTDQKFHPLFGYEILALIGIFLLLQVASSRQFCQSRPSRLLAIYVGSYCLVRFGLDFLRPDKTIWPALGLGINQVICLIMTLVTTVWLVAQLNQHRKVVRSHRR